MTQRLFFRSVAVTDHHRPASTFVSTDTPPDNANFQFSIITPSTVYGLLLALNVRKSVGPDGISARFLKEITGVIVDLLTNLFNKSLQSGVFPDE